MASVFLNRRLFSLTNISSRIRLLTTLNNRSGIASFINDDDLNLWSENNWSTFGKQFNKPKEFPLPGQIGLTSAKQGFTNDKENLFLTLNDLLEQKKVNKEDSLKQFDPAYCPLPKDRHLNTIMQAQLYQNDIDSAKRDENMRDIYKNFELKAFKCPASLLQDFQACIPTTRSGLTLITVCLKTENDMATYNDAVEDEREVLMQKFIEIAQDVCVKIKKNGYWADFIDPSSGKPFAGPYTHATFYETDERYRNFGFEVIDYGCCKVVSHHIWGTKSFVGSILTSAPHENPCVQNLVISANENQ